MTESDNTAAPNETALRALTLALRSEEEAVRLSALADMDPAALGQTGASGLRLLIDSMGDESYRVRKQAARLAALFPDPPLAASLLVEALAEPEDVGRRNAALEAVVRLGSPCVPPLLSALSGKPEHRKVLLDALGAIADVRAVPAMQAGLLDEDPNVRAASAEGLAQIKDSVVVPILRQVISAEPDRVVRLAALQGLNRHKVALPLAEVEPFLDEVVLRPSALLLLGFTGEPSAASALLSALLDRAPGAREAAMAGLCHLYRGLADPTKRAEIGASLRSLSELSIRSMIRALLEASPDARSAAAVLLGVSRHPEAIRPLILALLDHHKDVAAAALSAILDLGAEAKSPLQAMHDSLPEGGAERATIRQALSAFAAHQTAP